MPLILIPIVIGAIFVGAIVGKTSHAIYKCSCDNEHHHNDYCHSHNCMHNHC